ncbi:hypothetical protein DPMN_088298 [Dreissena polymorpha]|uniref:Uncharacterized protein n=1 Tax=Dreissena polymorpha TaxID=45954 RepID=A0A9D4KUS2_DREPO|nr:hypothetical protein DPMN_088298 [Dreissena polymorpha]
MGDDSQTRKCETTLRLFCTSSFQSISKRYESSSRMMCGKSAPNVRMCSTRIS